MLSSVLNSDRAIQVNIEIMRAFVNLRRMLASNVELADKLKELESKYDRQFKVVFDAIRRLMSSQRPARKTNRLSLIIMASTGLLLACQNRIIGRGKISRIV
jgi:DnaJ-domain-containing protein 1